MARTRLGTVRWGLMLLVAAAAGLAGGGAASASGPCTGKCALAQLQPTAVGAGSTTGFTLTLTNEASPQSLGSADLTAPSGWVLQPSPAPALSSAAYTVPSTATAEISDTTLELRGLSLPSGDSVTATFTATALCGAASSPWPLLAKQANAFNGPPGNDFTTDAASTLTVTVTGNCTLSFHTQPANTSFPVGGGATSNDITSAGFDPSGVPVEVMATDGLGHPISGVDVTLSLAYSSGGSLSGSTSETTDGSGLATYPNALTATPLQAGLTVDQTGYYELQANAPGFPAADSAVFQITDNASSCTGGSCSGNDSNKSVGLSVTVTNPPSGDILSLGLGGFTYSCAAYQNVTGSLGVDLWLPGGTSIDGTQLYEPVTITISKQLVEASPNNGASFYQVCYASTQPFSGGSLSTTYQIPGSAATYIGLLQDCPSQPVAADAPCVVSRTKTKAGQVLITFLAGPGDIWGTA